MNLEDKVMDDDISALLLYGKLKCVFNQIEIFI